MSAIAVIGEAERVRAYALAGVHVGAVEEGGSFRAAWDALPADTALVLLTPAARAALGELDPRDPRLWVVMPG